MPKWIRKRASNNLSEGSKSMPSWERSGMTNHNYPLANVAEKIILNRQTSLQSQELKAHQRGLDKHTRK